MRAYLSLAGLFLTVAGPAFGTIYTVNPDGTGDFPTILAAVIGVVDGDVIELTDGTFVGDGNRDVSYLGKAITIRSASGNAAACILDCEGSQSDPLVHQTAYVPPPVGGGDAGQSMPSPSDGAEEYQLEP